MRALLCRSLDEGLDGLRIEEIAPRTPGPGQVRIAVRATGLNFADTLLVRGRYQVKPPLPFAPGLEAAGEVIDVGADVDGLVPGDRVLALLDYGGLAEEVIARAEDVCVLPPGMDDITAAAFPVAYGTAYMALAVRAQLRPDETLVVFGASGGVGLTAVEVGNALGARVIAVASTAEKLAIARERGADELIAYTTEPVRERLEALGGVDVVYDPVGGELFEAGLHVIRPGGRIVIIGFASGTVPQIPANLLLVKDAAALGMSLTKVREHEPHRLQAAMRDLLTMYAEGRLRPHVSHTLPLDRAVEGLRLLGGATTGKVVVTL